MFSSYRLLRGAPPVSFVTVGETPFTHPSERFWADPVRGSGNNRARRAGGASGCRAPLVTERIQLPWQNMAKYRGK